jgi:hypothetical protein
MDSVEQKIEWLTLAIEGVRRDRDGAKAMVESATQRLDEALQLEAYLQNQLDELQA